MHRVSSPAGLLGILGGMGPAATADFLSLLAAKTPAAYDQAHIPLIMYSNPQTPDRSDAIRGIGADPLPQLLAGVRFLDAAGCTAIAIPCNSAHYWFEQLQAAVSKPILHIVDAAIGAITDRSPAGPIGVLATEGTLASGIYSGRLEALGYEPLVPDPWLMNSAVTPGILLTKAGDLAGAHRLLLRAVDELQSRGASHVILGCTDISASLRDDTQRQTRPLVDASDALALAVVRRFLPPVRTDARNK